MRSEQIKDSLKQHDSLLRTSVYCGLALIAFAANSVLCRLALAEKTIDASSFTAIRLLAGAVVLAILIGVKRSKKDKTQKGSWFASAMLFLYAITFSFAYINLDTATGALILFGSVQITMIIFSFISGVRLHIAEWMGFVIAFTGFVYLVLPAINTPSAIGFFLMVIAGVTWGIYTLQGKHSKNPLMDTAYNFIRTIPFIGILVIVTFNAGYYSFEGVMLAIISGGIASGIGYTIWYAALGGLTPIQASTTQLLVPIIAALGGIVFMSEALTLRLLISASMILGGVLILIMGNHYFAQSQLHKKT